MTRTTTAIATVALASLVVSSPAFAGQRSRPQGRSGGRVSGQHAAPPARQADHRPPSRVYAPRGGSYYRGYSYRPYSYYPYSYYRPYYYPPYGHGLNFSLFYGYPGYYGYGYPGVYGGYYGAYPYGYGYGYGPGGYVSVAPGRPYGGVRIDLPERDAEVYADGYYAGVVDDFDGALQSLTLEPGPHRIEIRAAGFAPVAFDVNVEPGRTITYRTQLRR